MRTRGQKEKGCNLPIEYGNFIINMIITSSTKEYTQQKMRKGQEQRNCEREKENPKEKARNKHQ